MAREAKKSEEVKPVRCDACNVKGDGDHPLEPITVEGHLLTACVDPVKCRERAQKLGSYKRV